MAPLHPIHDYADVVERLAGGQIAAFTVGGQPFTITPARDSDGHFCSFRDTAAVAKPLMMAARADGDAYRWASLELEPEHLAPGPFNRADTLPLDENAVADDAQPADPRRGERAFLRAIADVKRRLEQLAEPDRA